MGTGLRNIAGWPIVWRARRFSGPVNRRRGTVAIALLIVLIGLQMAIVLSTSGGARDQLLASQRLSNIRAFSAAETGVNMALREVYAGVDEDGDGTIGSISNDGNTANDPSLGGGASVSVAYSTSSGSPVLTSTGRCMESRRVIVTTLQSSP